MHARHVRPKTYRINGSCKAEVLEVRPRVKPSHTQNTYNDPHGCENYPLLGIHVLDVPQDIPK